MVFGNIFNRGKSFFGNIYNKIKEGAQDVYGFYQDVKKLPVFDKITSNLENNLVKIGNDKINDALSPYLKLNS
jgi:hypothetical protein